MTDGLGVDMAFDTSNTVDAFRGAIYSVRKGGYVYPIGEHPSLPLDLSEISNFPLGRVPQKNG